MTTDSSKATDVTRLIAVANLKGGTGKSTTAANLACAWGSASASRRVLAVDLDPQGDLTAMFGRYPDEGAATIDDLFVDPDASLADATIHQVAPGVDLVPAGPRLASVEITLAGEMGAEFFLADLLRGQVDAYGVVLIDCPPQLGKLTPNALFAAGELIVPISMIDRGAYSGAAELLAKVEEVRKRQELRVLALVRTQVDRKRRAYRALNSELASLRARVAETEIPLRSAFHDAGVMGQPVMLSGPDSPGACAYRNLAAELANPRLAREAA